MRKHNIKGAVAKTTLAAMLLTNSFVASAEEINFNPSTLTITQNSVIPNEYIVVFKEDVSVSSMKKEILAFKGKVVREYWDAKMATVKLSKKQYNQMQSSDKVAILEPNTEVYAESSKPLAQYSHEKTNVQAAWSQNLKGKGINIAVLDSGVSKHDDLHIAGGASFVGYTDSYADDSGHGTHVAGIIGALDNGVGTTGVASEANIYAVKVLKKNGKGSVGDIVAGLDWAIKKGVDIINISIGVQQDHQALRAKVDEAEEKGIIVVAAAGNTGDEAKYPAIYENVVAVGATNANNKIASFSSRGKIIKVVAPGDEIVSTYLDNKYATGKGTSQAAPYVAGMLALYKQAYPEKSPKEIVNMLYKNALDLGLKGRDIVYGYGLVQFPDSAIVEEPEKPVEENDKDTTVPFNYSYDHSTNALSWTDFGNTPKYLIELGQKVSQGNYQRVGVIQGTNKKNEVTLDEVKFGNQYRIIITPRNSDKSAETLYVKTNNDGSKTFSFTEFADEKPNITWPPTVPPVTVEPPVTIPPIEELPQPPKEEVEKPTEKPDVPFPGLSGITMNAKKTQLIWTEIPGAIRYRVLMSEKNTSGEYVKYDYDRFVVVNQFDLTILQKNNVYRLTIVPFIDNDYDFSKAYKVQLDTTNFEIQGF